MGYQCFEMTGRDQGYGAPAKCDHPDCAVGIDGGVGFACGGDPAENCGLFFCRDHLAHDVNPEAEWSSDNRHEFGVCERCAVGAVSFDPSPDTEYWRAWKMNHNSWKKRRSESPRFCKINEMLIGHEQVMLDILDEGML